MKVFNKYLVLGLVMYRIMLVVLVLYAASGNDWENVWFPDTGGYSQVADDLDDWELDSPIGRVPGYPFVLALFSKVFDEWQAPVIILQMILDLLIGLMIWSVARVAGKYRLIPVIMYMLHPYSIVFAIVFLPATLTAFLVMATFYISSKGELSTNLRAIIIGILIAVGISIRPMLIYSGFMYGGYYLLRVLISTKKFKIMPLILVIVLSNVSVVLMKSYNQRNYSFSEISTQSKRELTSRILILTGKMTASEATIWTRSIQNTYKSNSGEVNYHAIDSVFSFEARRELMQNPLPIVSSHLFGWLRYFTPEQKYLGIHESYKAIPIVLRVLVSLYVVTVFFLLISGMLLGAFNKSEKSISRELSILGLLWFIYAAVVHAKLCYSYYAVPFIGLWITSGYIGWYTYIETKIQEPNSLLSKIVQKYRKHA